MSNGNTGVKERFILFCNKNRIQQKTLAVGIGLSEQAVCRWFHLDKETPPSLDAIRYLMKNHNLDANWLIGEGKTNE